MTAARPLATPLPEEHVQYAVARVLDELDPPVLWFHPPNEALQRGGLVYGAQLVGLGVKTGVPDIIICEAPPALPGVRGVALELKSARGSASPDQRRWLGALQGRGWAAYVEHGTHAALARLRALGWDVDAALSRLAERGEAVDERGKLARSQRS